MRNWAARLMIAGLLLGACIVETDPQVTLPAGFHDQHRNHPHNHNHNHNHNHHPGNHHPRSQSDRESACI